MRYEIRRTTQFKKDFELILKRGLDISEFQTVLNYLINGDPLPAKYKDHPLQPSKGYKNCRELHIKPDWLLVYKYSNENVILYLIRTGTHSDLF